MRNGVWGVLEVDGFQFGYQRPSHQRPDKLLSLVEVSEYLVGSPAFKAGVRCDPS